MTSKERVIMLLKRQIPDRMGIFEHFWPETLRDYWAQEGYPEIPKDPTQQWKMESRPEYYFDYDIHNCGGWFDSSFFPGKSEVIEETDEWQVIKGGNLATLKCWKHKSGTPEHVGFEVTTPEKWRQYKDTLLYLDKQRFGDIEAIKANVTNARIRNKFVVFGNLFVFELMRGIVGDVNFLPALLLEPDWIKELCQTYLNMFKLHYEYLFKEVGLPDGMFIFEDFGFTNGLFCSPQTMKELIVPYEEQLVSFFHDYGLPVLLHSCGDIRKAVPLIIDAGFDCLQPMEAKAGCNVVEMAKEYGTKISYMGNINVVPLSTNDKKNVEQEIVPKLKQLNKMRIPYFFHSDHSIPPNVNLDTYKFALQLFYEHSRYE
jgi:hypothetical protein